MALLGAATLHLAVLAVFLLRPANDLLPMGTVVPVTLVAHDPTTDSRPAVAAPVTQTAQTEQPAPRAPAPEAAAPPPPPAPRAAPTPERSVRPIAKPVPAPRPSPVPLKPAPAAKPQSAPQSKPQTKPTPKTDTFNLDSIAADVATQARRSPPHPAAAAKGPTRVETAPQARVDAGQGVSQSDIAGLSQLLNRLWNKSCNLDETVIVPVSFTIGEDGRVSGRANAAGAERSGNTATAVAARRAIDAVHQAEPYAAVYRGKAFRVIFDAKKACGD